MSKDNIVLLPTTAAELELEVASLMQKKDFSSALDHLKLLLTYEHQPYNVYRDTLTCLIKLSFTDDAMELCEELLMDGVSEHYYDYLEFYVLLLYETENYAELLHIVESEEANIPETNAARINDFKTLATQMRAWQRDETLALWQQAITEKDAPKQYRILSKWKRENFPVPDLFITQLIEKNIHPVIKTKLFQLLQEKSIQKNVEIKKFDKTLFAMPTSIPVLTKHPSYLASLSVIEDVEQQNPVLYMHTKELIDNHAYVLYPFLYKEKKAVCIAHAALAIAKANLGLEEPVLSGKEAKSVLMSQELYQRVILQ